MLRMYQILKVSNLHYLCFTGTTLYCTQVFVFEERFNTSLLYKTRQSVLLHNLETHKKGNDLILTSFHE